jgi:V/A-type H+-transporting ATPase subunit A
MLKTIMAYHVNAEAALDRGAASADIISIPVKDEIGRMKYLPESEFEDKVKEIQEAIVKQCSEV